MNRIQIKTNKIYAIVQLYPCCLLIGLSIWYHIQRTTCTEPTFTSKKQWVPRRPPKFRNLEGRQKKFFGVPSKPWTKSPPLRRHVRRLHTNVPRTLWQVVRLIERWHNKVITMANAGVCRNSTGRDSEVLGNGWVDLRVTYLAVLTLTSYFFKLSQSVPCNTL